MSAPTDICADCAHRREDHGLVAGVYPTLRCVHGNCPCLAFDEGAPKEGLGATLTRSGAFHLLRTFIADAHDHAARPCGLCDGAAEALAVLSVASTRIEAAGRAVIEAALENQPAWDQCMRLRDLREQAWAEECGATIEIQTHNVSRGIGGVLLDATNLSRTGPVECHLPRGHEGEHEGDLGSWRWEGA